MKKKTLLSSILVIALCLTLIVGSTFALFTSEDSVNIVVDAGRVEIAASLTEPVLYSVQPDANGTEFDENGKPYTYQEQTGSFANGGTATLNQTTGEIELENITPGDKIVFNLNGTNNSDVKVQYRYKLECVKGYDLMKGFVVTVNGTKYASMAAYTSAWEPLAKGENIMVDTVDGGVEFALELPVSAGNEFQELSATIKLSVEAIQDNADISDTDVVTVKYITSVATAAELSAKLASDEYLHIFVDQDITDLVEIKTDLEGKTIDADGHSVNLSFGVSKTEPVQLTDVVVKNLATPTLAIKSGVSGDLTIKDSQFTSAGKNNPKRLISGAGVAEDELSVTIDGCVLDAGSATESAVYFFNIKDLTIKNTTIKNTTSWAVMQANGSISGNVVFSDCVFENCVGITKGAIEGGTGSGSLSGNFTFANNKIINCTKKESKTNSGIFVFMNVTPIQGVITFSNNTVDDVVVTVADMGMLGN